MIIKGKFPGLIPTLCLSLHFEPPDKVNPHCTLKERSFLIDSLSNALARARKASFSSFGIVNLRMEGF
jgi:hypothetical protein